MDLEGKGRVYWEGLEGEKQRRGNIVIIISKKFDFASTFND